VIHPAGPSAPRGPSAAGGEPVDPASHPPRVMAGRAGQRDSPPMTKATVRR
jgi:hypothetical protein